MKRILLLSIGVVLIAGCSAGTNDNAIDKPTMPEATSHVADSFAGSWASDCLVPDAKSAWAEQHFFTFSGKNATYNRKAYYKASCEGTPDIKEEKHYTYTLEEKGQIDFYDTDAGTTFYDVYGIEGGVTLRFGHGFRNHQSTDLKNLGDNAAHRIPDLNLYIVYKKK